MASKPYYKPNGYSTDHLIDSLTDEQLLDHMGVPARFWWNVIHNEREIPSQVVGWLERIRHIFRPTMEMMGQHPDLPGTGLVLHGPSGSGKTTLASVVLLGLVRQKIPNTDPSGRNFTWHGAAMGRFFDWQTVSETFRGAAGGDDLHGVNADEVRTAMRPDGRVLRRADFLVVDDISRERKTEFNSGELHRILRQRHNNCFPTIITTNHSPEEWDEVYGDVMTAFMHRAFIPVEVD